MWVRVPPGLFLKEKTMKRLLSIVLLALSVLILAPKCESSEDLHKINTAGWQDSVFISPDGNELYFAYLPFAREIFWIYISEEKQWTVDHGPFRPGHKNQMSFDTYVSTKQPDGTWGTPVNLNINADHSLYSAKLSHDGTKLYYVIRNYKNNIGNPDIDDIYVSNKLANGKWRAPFSITCAF